jgi:hypothetical protein
MPLHCDVNYWGDFTYVDGRSLLIRCGGMFIRVTLEVTIGWGDIKYLRGVMGCQRCSLPHAVSESDRLTW